MICVKCSTRFGLITDGGIEYASDDEGLCYQCLYQGDIEREILREVNGEIDRDCQIEIERET